MINDNLLLEISKQRLMNNTDRGRKFRAVKHVRTIPPKVTQLGESNHFIEYRFKAYPFTSLVHPRHWGYIVYDPKKKDIKELFCDCEDYFYRLYAPMVKNKLAKWGLSHKYDDRLIKVHNKKWTVKTNPTGTLFLCKHLAALMSYI